MNSLWSAANSGENELIFEVASEDRSADHIVSEALGPATTKRDTAPRVRLFAYSTHAHNAPRGRA